MINLILLLAIVGTMHSNIIFDFSKGSDIKGWRIIDDVVMGGRSSGNFRLDPNGFGIFEGNVSLENNGGFSLVSHQFNKIEVKDFSKIVLKVRGDGKKYQFRIKSDLDDYYSFVTYFMTSGEWQEIQIPLDQMYPTFRGRKLDMDNFSGEFIEEVAILIGNKKNENFKLMIDRIELK